MAKDGVDVASILLLQSELSPTETSLETAESLPPTPKPNCYPRRRKRSSRACRTCRARKVRCNIVPYGAPCSNCRSDEIECMLAPKVQRSRRSRSFKASVQADRAGDQDFMESENVEMLSEIRSQSHSGVKICIDILEQDGLVMETSDIESRAVSPQPRTCTTPVCRSQDLEFGLDGVFTLFPSHLDSADLAYLKLRDALTVPNKVMQIELLKAYIQGIHSTLPILDLDEFLSMSGHNELVLAGKDKVRSACKGTSEKKISLLLFQAVLFAGVEYVSTKVLNEAGFCDRQSAKVIFFRRVRLLYDFDTCNDHLSIVQSLLLMSLWPPNINYKKESKDTWHWLGLATSMAFDLGLNRDIPTFGTLSDRERLNRRIWWTIFVRDRTLAFNANGIATRVFRIRKEDCKMEMLNLSDFGLAKNEGSCETMDSLLLRKHASECVERVMLCWKIEDGSISVPKMTTYSTFSLQPTQTHQNQLQQLSSNSSSTSSDIPCLGPAGSRTWKDSEYVEEYTSSPSSISEACHDAQTPQQNPGAVPVTVEAYELDKLRINSSHDVVGEYEDYLEYFNVSKIGREPVMTPTISSMEIGR